MIPDTQVKPGVPIDHFTWIGKYIADKRPDYVVHIGDHWDMPSLSSYDKGKKSFEGRRYKDDIASGNAAMSGLLKEFWGIDGYRPQMHFCIGNHEQRIERAVEAQRELDGVIGYHDFQLSNWTVHPFLKVVELEGIKFSHYFTSGVMGHPAGSAAVMLREAMGSAIQGHVQKVDFAVHPKTGHIAMMVGTCYLHLENYLGEQGNDCRRQVVMLNECRSGIYDPMLISLRYLKNRYGK